MRTTLRIAVLLAIVLPELLFAQDKVPAPLAISIVLEGPSEIRLEQKATYQIQIRNAAAVPSAKITVRAHVPAEELFQEIEAALKISKLPDEPNHEEINKLSIEILESWFTHGCGSDREEMQLRG